MYCKVVSHHCSGWCLRCCCRAGSTESSSSFQDTWSTIFIVQTKTWLWHTSHFPRFISQKIFWNSTDFSELPTRKHFISHATEILVFPLKQSVQNKQRLLLIIRCEVWEVSVPVDKGNLHVRTGSSVYQAHSLFVFVFLDKHVHPVCRSAYL